MVEELCVIINYILYDKYCNDIVVFLLNLPR